MNKAVQRHPRKFTTAAIAASAAAVVLTLATAPSTAAVIQPPADPLYTPGTCKLLSQWGDRAGNQWVFTQCGSTVTVVRSKGPLGYCSAHYPLGTTAGRGNDCGYNGPM